MSLVCSLLESSNFLPYCLTAWIAGFSTKEKKRERFSFGEENNETNHVIKVKHNLKPESKEKKGVANYKKQK